MVFENIIIKYKTISITLFISHRTFSNNRNGGVVLFAYTIIDRTQ